MPIHVHIFAICNDAVRSMMKKRPGVNGSKTHGPNSIISMLHHYMENKSTITTFTQTTAQDRTKQFCLAYFMWRVLVGLNEEIVL